MPATASGSDAGPGGSARARDHNQGNQERKYTVEQKAAVIRIRKCSTTAYYEILSLEKSATDGEIKKAYRKLSLLTHPDKNGYDGADEAFKLVSRAFQVLSDPDKKSRYDKFGGDPDSRFNPGAAGPSGAGPSPFSGFANARRPAGGGGSMFEEEISPEELFNRFFGGGAFGGSAFGGPQFVFNMGGGPGFRVHQFGGSRPRRRPREANAAREAPLSTWSMVQQLLPLILLFVLPLLSSLFSGSSTPVSPSYRVDTAVPPHTMHRTTPKMNINYFVNPSDVKDYSSREFNKLDQRVEVEYVQKLRYECDHEVLVRDRLIQDAQGWFFPDVEKMKEARAMELKSCNRLKSMNVRL
ncbi:hypothetical protein ASPZODRAFT_134790 [Penicilliopsis zonata CBS 506.65]|uniref:J domain-containing protein n=1 Tax=Penicilliopsis zonata CBS 506.65 TaxID=1073090 RepID=A0A1L9SC74_9EURO|nr:hypothetical protein ASPZODRAFT_134790 [Penicilliopsis zonata CBS 506.65]OJJ44697.1 hypothetical protein ASPZODRAFT_134790 [Penicilliopsis zonata CBS 506.65]